MIPGLPTAKLIAFAAAAAAILSFVLLAFHWKGTMTERGKELATICAAARAAADNPKLDCKKVPQQIAALGDSLKAVTGALNDQNAKVAALGQQTAQQQAESSAALKNAQGRAQKADATSQRLAASSRSTVPQNGSCDASKALKDAWQ